METYKFWKKAIFSVKKKFGLLFSPVIDCDKPQGTFYKCPQSILTITVEVARPFL